MRRFWIGLGLACLALVAIAQQVQLFEGSGYTVLKDSQGRCLIAVASSALPTNVVCQDGALLYRTDNTTWYSSTAAVWSAYAPTYAVATITTLNSTTQNSTSEALSGGNGGSQTTGSISENITLSTGATTTDSAANLLPINSIIDAVNCRVTTTITTAANWQVGDSVTAARFIPSNSNITANAASETVGLAAMAGVVSTTATGPTQAAAAKLRITTNVNPGAGAIRCTVFFRSFVAPTS